MWTARTLLVVGTVALLASAGSGATTPPVCPQTDLGTALPTSVSGTTEGASSSLIGSCGGDGPEVTFLYTAPVAGSYVFNTRGSDFDTILYLRDASCAGQELECNDDFDGTLSQVTVDLTAGQAVVVVVDALDTGGSFTLNIARLDSAPPQLTALSFPSTLDLGAEPATVTVSYSATDDASGVAFFEIEFAIPDVGCGVGNFDSDFPPTLNRSGEFSVDLPENTPGIYVVCDLYLCDAQDNCRDYTAAELAASGFPTELTVVSGPPGSRTPTPTPPGTPTGSATSPPTAPPSPTRSTASAPTPTPTVAPTGSATSSPTATRTNEPTGRATSTTTAPPTGTPPPIQSPTASQTATPTASPTETQTTVAVCPGDCGGDGAVTVEEIITLVNIALGTAAPSACPQGTAVDITLIVQAVHYALGTCPV